MTIEIEKAYLLTNTSCNDACRYCIVRKGHEFMSDETVNDALDLLFSTAGQTKKVALYGGEPLLRFDLIERAGGDSVYADFVREHGYGVHHFGVLVDDMDAALAQARAAGLEMTMDGAGFGRDGDGHYAYLDTEEDLGTTLELIARPKGRIPPERVYPPEEA